MNKRELLENTPPEAWLQRGGPNGFLSLWDLHPRWCYACFGDGYRRIYRDADPWSDTAGNIGFLRADGLYDLVVFSKVTPMHHFELQWQLGAGRCDVLLNGEPCPQADASASPNDPRLLELRCREPEEAIQFHLDTLEAGTVRVRAAQEAAAIDPWKRLLAWYGLIRTNDPETYQRRMHNGFRQFVDSTPPEALTLQHLQYFQAQRLLPEALPDLVPEETKKLLQDLKQLQAHMGNPQVAPRIPRILFGLAPERLEREDIQALIVMGAIKDTKSFVERELQKLIARRPDIRKILDTPNGRAQVFQLPEFLAIMQLPEAQQERTDSNERAMRSQGVLEGIDVESFLQQQKMMQAYTGQIPVTVPPPPWRVYRPFDPSDPHQQQPPLQGQFMGFDFREAWSKMGF